ncbi:hypothetical protein [Caenispirillum salinarum]|uniref:hypothetical protein n=1 Tax=Caenispirillum salinarum TaxID=859058 RepID=UPI00384CE3FF
MTEKHPLNVRVDADLYWRVKGAAIRRRMTLTGLVELALEEYLWRDHLRDLPKKQRKEEKKRRKRDQSG